MKRLLQFRTSNRFGLAIPACIAVLLCVMDGQGSAAEPAPRDKRIRNLAEKILSAPEYQGFERISQGGSYTQSGSSTGLPSGSASGGRPTKRLRSRMPGEPGSSPRQGTSGQLQPDRSGRNNQQGNGGGNGNRPQGDNANGNGGGQPDPNNSADGNPFPNDVGDGNDPGRLPDVPLDNPAGGNNGNGLPNEAAGNPGGQNPDAFPNPNADGARGANGIPNGDNPLGGRAGDPNGNRPGNRRPGDGQPGNPDANRNPGANGNPLGNPDANGAGNPPGNDNPRGGNDALDRLNQARNGQAGDDRAGNNRNRERLPAVEPGREARQRQTERAQAVPPPETKTERDRSSSSSGGFAGFFTSLIYFLAYLMIGVVCGFIIWLIIKTIMEFRWPEKAVRNIATGTPKSATEPERPPGEHPPDAYVARARELAASGQYRDAVAQLLLGAMSRSERAGWVRFQRGLTVRNYLQALNGRATEYNAFRGMVRIFEPLTFGRRDPLPEHFEQSLKNYEAGFARSSGAT